MNDELVRMEGISKSFPGVQALADCRFELRRGEVHALVGENGAGKSTLMKILTGVYAKDAGTIRIRGKETDIPDTKTAQRLGIAMIHQELNLVPALTVAQNIMIGREPRRFVPLFLNEKKLEREAADWLDRLRLKLDPRARVADLTVARQQLVEIAKAISCRSDTLIMDEPTAALTDAEIGDLFAIIRRLKAEGVGIVYISHRMEELKAISDRITVMRDGRCIDTVATADAPVERIIAMMVGREIEPRSAPAGVSREAEIVLEARHLNRGRAVRDVSLQLRKGEIVGLSGLMGAGRTETARALFGADPLDSGEIRVNGRKVKIRQPRDAVRAGIGYLSEDRKRFGLLVDMDVQSNLSLPSWRRFSRLGWMRNAAIRHEAGKTADDLKIKTPSLEQKVKFLSGGNQQKVVIGKWLMRDCDILIFDEPTRGIDVGAKAEIYGLLESLAAQGKAIVVISSELPEILRVSHRIVVMCEGRVTGELTAAEATQEAIMKLATDRNA